MKKSKVAGLLLAILFAVSTPQAEAALSASWTLEELSQELEKALNSNDPLKALIAGKVYEAMQEKGIQFVDGNLEYGTSAYPAWRAGEDAYNADKIKNTLFDVVNAAGEVKHVGSCSIPLPLFSLLAIEGGEIPLKGILQGGATAFTLSAAQGDVRLGVDVHGLLKSDADLGIVWGGTYPVPGTKWVCVPVPPYPCGSIFNPKWCDEICGYVPIVEWKCEDWKDRAGLKVRAEVKGNIALTLETSYSLSDRQITLNKKVGMSGEIWSVNGYINDDHPDFGLPKALIPYITPDFTVLTGPTPSSPISAGIIVKVTNPLFMKTVLTAALLKDLLMEYPVYTPLLAPLIAPLAPQIDGLLVGLSLASFPPGFEQDMLNDRYQEWLAQQNAAFEAKGYNQPIVLQLPDDADGRLLAIVLQLLRNSGFTDVLVDFVNAHLHEILYYLLTDNRDALQQLFATAAACEAVKALAASLPNVPIYTTTQQGACEAADVNGADRGRYFSDAQCAQEIAFRPTPAAEYCETILSAKPNTLLGNAASWTADPNQPNDPAPDIPSRKWTQWLGTRLAVTTDPIVDNSSPFMKRVRYRDVTSTGQTQSCALEMRIYKKDITALHRPAVLALHGGSWAYRGGAFMGLEATISHYTEQGFTVFAPFYRLAGASDASPECRGAQWQEVVSDAEAALDWVKLYGPLFGASTGGKVAVTGQSAGAHLSGWLITHRPDDVSAGLLHYGPTDVRDMLTHARPGGLYEPFIGSLGILSNFFGADVTQVDINNPPDFVVQNSFADIVRNSTQPVPPVFILHGKADTLVPSNQGVVLCNAYGGSAVDDGGGLSLRAIYGCGSSGGQLHLFEQGQHGLDACAAPQISQLCLAGSQESALLVAQSSREGRAWLYERTVLPTVVPVARITASQTANGAPANVLDGNMKTAWSARGNGQYLQLDLGAVRQVGAIGVVWGPGMQPPAASLGVRTSADRLGSTSFEVQTSVDSVSWTKVFSGQGSGASQTLDVFDFADSGARYLRFVVRGSTHGSSLRVAELRVYGPATPRKLTVTAVTANNQPPGRTRRNFGEPHHASHVPKDHDQWVRYDLGAVYAIAHLILASPHIPEGKMATDIQFSVDGANWVTAARGRRSGPGRLLDFREAAGRFVRVSVPGKNQKAIMNAEIYGASL